MRAGARSVLKWFAGLYVVLIIVQVFLAGEGIFGLNNIKNSDDCDKTKVAADCIGNSKTLDPHRALGFILTGPGALLFLIVALIALHSNKRIRTVSIVLPFLLFIQMHPARRAAAGSARSIRSSPSCSSGCSAGSSHSSAVKGTTAPAATA